ncbi:MAG: hypothetical protein IJU40_06110 [Desulfovibrionaceae bacterium]|nr:hypothetical protein [Desulfovibrionaceae bacterium]
MLFDSSLAFKGSKEEVDKFIKDKITKMFLDPFENNFKKSKDKIAQALKMKDDFFEKVSLIQEWLENDNQNLKDLQLIKQVKEDFEQKSNLIIQEMNQQKDELFEKFNSYEAKILDNYKKSANLDPDSRDYQLAFFNGFLKLEFYFDNFNKESMSIAQKVSSNIKALCQEFESKIKNIKTPIVH